MKVLSLFDGISCGMVALERAGIPIEEYSAFEIDKYATKISEKNYPKIKRYGDVFDGDFGKFKGYDLLIGGSPCTYWSIAKKSRETTTDGEGFRLFMQYVRALEESGCKHFLYENNFSIHRNIKDEISKRLGVQPIMINSALLSAQQRKRCYWTNIPNVTQPEDKRILLMDILESGMPVNEIDGKSRTIKAQYSRTGSANALRGDGFGATMVHDGQAIRKLSPVEAERLQTLPDNYTAGISDTQRYKCIGNGWTVDVIAHILKNMK